MMHTLHVALSAAAFTIGGGVAVGTIAVTIIPQRARIAQLLRHGPARTATR